MNNLPDNVTTIIGLEIHVQLQTASKLFCGCTTSFGSPPNTQTCPVCTGMPGALPVVNQHALELSIVAGLGLGCKIATETKWDRKNYFYPDLPKGYQISQLDQPICGPGQLEFSLPKQPEEKRSVRITRAHLEEDAGKSIHDESNRIGKSKIDLNRAGTPLLEIVTEPDLRSPVEARAFLTELKLLLTYLAVSDCNMQQGNLRVDANVNLHIDEDGATIPTPIVEIKNLNSFRAVERALTFEIERQWEAWQANRTQIGEIPKSTRGWDDKNQTTVPQREKEESADYRYFPDPDLSTVSIAHEEIEERRRHLPELPQAIRRRLQTEYRIQHYDADVIVSQGRGVVRYFETLAGHIGQGKAAANWVTQHVLRILNESETAINDFPIPAAELGKLIAKQIRKELDQSRARQVFDAMFSNKLSADEAMKHLGFRSLSDDEMEAICERLIADNQEVWNQVIEGNTKAVGALIGAGKKLNSNIDAGKLRAMLLARAKEPPASNGL